MKHNSKTNTKVTIRKKLLSSENKMKRDLKYHFESNMKTSRNKNDKKKSNENRTNNIF